MLVCTTGCSGVANLRSPPQARNTGIPPSLDAPQSTSLSRSLSWSLLTPRTCNSAAVSTCTYLVVAKNNIRPPRLNFVVYITYMLPRRLRLLDVLLLAYIIMFAIVYCLIATSNWNSSFLLLWRFWKQKTLLMLSSISCRPHQEWRYCYYRAINDANQFLAQHVAQGLEP